MAKPLKLHSYMTNNGTPMALSDSEWKIVGSEQHEHSTDVWEEPFVPFRLPKVFDVRSGPFESADHEGMDYLRWGPGHHCVFETVKQYVGHFLAAFRGLRQRQKVGSHSLDRVMRNLSTFAKGVDRC